MKPGRIAGKGGMRQKTAENSTGKRNNVENFIEIVVFAVLVGIASAVTLWLFYRQCVESMLGTGLYHSDMKAYILEMQGLDSGYSFPFCFNQSWNRLGRATIISSSCNVISL